MKILYSHYLAAEEHPAARMVAAIAHELRLLGHDVVVHRSAGPALPAAIGCGPPRRAGLRNRIRDRLWFAKAIARNRAMARRDRMAVERFTPDIVLARQDAYCWSMPYVCRRFGIPLVTYADAPVAYETRLFGQQQRWHPPGLVESIERRVLKSSRAIVTVSHPAARRLQRYGLDVPIHVIPNGIHPEWFPELTPERRAAERAALGLNAPNVVGFQGTFRPFHGLDLLRELMLRTAHRTDVQWLIIGDGPGRAALEEAVVGRVSAVFLGMQPAQRVGRLMQLTDVAIVPHAQLAGDFYFCPLKILESAAAGCALIASNQGDIPWLLNDGRAGLLVSEPDLPAWEAALDCLLEDPDHLESLGRDARRHVLENFTWRHTGKKLEQVLAQLLAEEGYALPGLRFGQTVKK